ncbi:MAG: hypothetical protein ACWGNV_15115 [Bacteroidales bacterium]
MITLESFKVHEKLTVKLSTIEPRSVKASYTVEKFTGEKASYELIYTYEKAYFNRKDPHDINLASMMLAQVALNYGLFFKTIEFDGLYDKTDKQFISDMMENTSREILTNKLLVPNVFIKAPYHTLKIEKRKRYTAAALKFTCSDYTEYKIKPDKAGAQGDRYAILSSGGKDSLLTYGIIREFGEPHPIFINEAGRHWFTAANAYKYYKQTEANTEKPWCNSDRLFSWMLKQLPFIREDFASVRADIYPVRLWTVAVFIFGALPIVRKKAIGNILIGNEYDTSIKGTLGGISHYNGLYDQSKYFDNALTRYYRAKGWNILQFSILRSLSEILIMKILLMRYPELQKHQISCHAAHEVDGRMYPCGKCEKCRRIVGMIKALGHNPEECGYTDKQIEDGLLALEQKSVKQIGSDAAQLYHMLRKKNFIRNNSFVQQTAKAYPEVLKLRFDRENSNLEDLPVSIRKALFGILGQYAEGAVQRNERKWTGIHLDEDFLNNTKYRFDER